MNKKLFKDIEGDNWYLRNKSSATYGQNDSLIKNVIHWLMPFQNNINLVLEVGCGDGKKINRLCNDLNSKGVGIDPSELAISDAKKKKRKKEKI